MRIKLLKDTQSPFVERKKILKKGTTFFVDDELGKQWIKDKIAKSGTPEDETQQTSKERDQMRNAMEKHENIENR